MSLTEKEYVDCVDINKQHIIVVLSSDGGKGTLYTHCAICFKRLALTYELEVIDDVQKE